ncbi:MAG: hypothetical protein QXZ17_05600 [Nitrososphaerota archaeon]
MKERILFTGFTVVEGAHFFSSFLPSIFTIKKFKESDEDANKIRAGYIPATAFCVGLGFIVSRFTRDEIPLIASIIVAFCMILAYESALRGWL